MTALHRQRHTVTLSDGGSIQIEAVRRDDWEGLDDFCPECSSTEFNHVQFEGGRYGGVQIRMKSEANCFLSDLCRKTTASTDVRARSS
jgi:hypothetical protein